LLDRGKQRHTGAAQAVADGKLFIAGALLAGLAAAVVFALFVIRSITRPLRAVVAAAESATKNDDFTHRVPVEGHCEVSRAAQSFNQLLDKFAAVVRETRGSVGEITDASCSLAEAAEQVTRDSGSQAEAASTVAAAVEEISVSASETSEHARQGETLAEQAREEAMNAMGITRRAMANLEEIAAAIKRTSAGVTQLAESSTRINGIINVIREIAEQTNLLALNAAIEAARAGEQGRGFAVVADEVRKLAERTAHSTQEIGGLIDGIQSQIAGTTEAMQAVDGQASQSADLAREAGGALEKIRGGSEAVTARVKDIAGAVREQSVAIQEIARNMERIAQMTEENNAAAGANRNTAERLDKLSRGLQQLVSRFQVA
ncbi:MAG: methyl-accepting chemotaxis protein, partial [Rhodocyclales bacterium]|nr:methyl-accepting chemotaxis protein [Rhodocyclales bacterium]